MDEGIDVTGHPLWVPLPLDAEPQAVEAGLRERFPEQEREVDWALGVHRQVGAGSGDEDALNLAAWVLVEDEGSFHPRAVATLRALRTGQPLTAADAVPLVVGDEPTYGEQVTDEVETASGPALLARWRPFAEVEGERQVHQAAAVVWARPDHGLLVVLSSRLDDLVEAEDLGQLLAELAAGVQGL